MTITKEDLMNIKRECDTMSKLIKEIVSSYQIDNSKRKLFVSRRDYEESLKIKNQIPQDFYFFRCFDVFVQIVFNKASKKYQLYVDGFYSDLLNKYTRLNEHSFEIGEDFDETFEVFHDVVDDVYHHKTLQDGLF